MKGYIEGVYQWEVDVQKHQSYRSCQSRKSAPEVLIMHTQNT